MRTTKYPLLTKKEIPSDAEIISHKLMLRSGMIHKLASGLYTWLPTGMRVLKKIENIIRIEINKTGAIEISMPIIQPEYLWKQSGRLNQYGLELFRVIDRHKHSFVLGPTHEEVVSNLIHYELLSYKELPLNIYQIQTKFRDEIRPKFGVMRSREFIMKDAYSFHESKKCLKRTYDLMYDSYNKIFNSMELDFRVVEANTGSIGGNISHEFHVLGCNGEDNLVFSSSSNYAANINLVTAISTNKKRTKPTQKLQLIDTPNIKILDFLVEKLNIPITCIIKTIIVKGNKENGCSLIALLIRSDHVLNKTKVEKSKLIYSPLTFATEEEIISTIGVTSNFIGPIGLKIPIIADYSVIEISDFCAGANINNKYYIGINWERDLSLPIIADIRNVVEGDMSPDGKGILSIKRGIEVGHIFQLGTKYSETMKAIIQDKKGLHKTLMMGCYGIGITRVVAAAIEQNHDERGIIWPVSLAPFEVVILPIQMYKDANVRETSETLYQTLLSIGIDILFYDCEKRPGIMFADIELIGIPHIIVISKFTLANKSVEYIERRNNKKEMISQKEIIVFLRQLLNK